MTLESTLKKLIKLAATAALMLSAPLFATEKMAVVDMQEVFNQLPQREEISKQLQNEFETRVNEVRNLQTQMKELYDKQQKDAALMSNEAKLQATRKIEELQAEYQLKAKAVEEDNRRRQAEERQKLILQIETAIKAISKKEGYTLIIDRAAAIHFSPEMNISSKVVEQVSKAN